MSGRRRHRRAAFSEATAPAERVTLTIDTLGAQGEGIARRGADRVFVPLTLPGEQVTVDIVGRGPGGLKARLVEVMAAVPDRTEPPCPHYGTCGGCALQHLAPAPHAAWKRDQVITALAQRGLSEVKVEAPIIIPLGRRRRTAFVVERADGRVIAGYSARASHRIVDIERCLLLTPTLDLLRGAIRRFAGTWLKEGERWRIHATESEGGLDVVIAGGRQKSGDLAIAARRQLAAFADEADLARLSWQSSETDPPEPIIVRRMPKLVLGGVAVEPPPGGFLQPSAEGEAVLGDLAVEGIGKAKRVADLFAGIGTLSLRLAAVTKVRAIDSDPRLIAARAKAAGAAGFSGRVETEVRDLDRRPLAGDELEPFSAVVFDPPRAGARVQAEALARAESVERVVAVSCNPATFARDARILVDGGFRLLRVVPVDQFTYAAHVEIVGQFRRG